MSRKLSEEEKYQRQLKRDEKAVEKRGSDVLVLEDRRKVSESEVLPVPDGRLQYPEKREYQESEEKERKRGHENVEGNLAHFTPQRS